MKFGLYKVEFKNGFGIFIAMPKKELDVYMTFNATLYDDEAEPEYYIFNHHHLPGIWPHPTKNDIKKFPNLYRNLTKLVFTL